MRPRRAKKDVAKQKIEKSGRKIKKKRMGRQTGKKSQELQIPAPAGVLRAMH